MYIGSENSHTLYAFNADGSGCSGVPKVCAPLASFTTGGSIESSATVVNGYVYVGSHDNKLSAFHL